MKHKVIKDYNAYIKRLLKGYIDSYQHILAEISFIDVYQDLDNKETTFLHLMNI